MGLMCYRLSVFDEMPRTGSIAIVNIRAMWRLW
jgi:hypothetical protein